MAVLDKVIELKNQGVQEPDIIKILGDGGISPKEIKDALSQAKIKQAVFPEQAPPTQGMEQSIMPEEEYQGQTEQTQEIQQQPGYYEQAYYQTPQAYPQQVFYPQQPQIDTETIAEIAEQVVSEKFQEFAEKTGDISSFKNQTTEELKDLKERLKKIENSIEQLQQAVIQKIGEFGEASQYIKKDLNNLHNTVSKLMNPLIDNYRELKKIAEKKQ